MFYKVGGDLFSIYVEYSFAPDSIWAGNSTTLSTTNGAFDTNPIIYIGGSCFMVDSFPIKQIPNVP